jgi:hypothetical protein
MCPDFAGCQVWIVPGYRRAHQRRLPGAAFNPVPGQITPQRRQTLSVKSFF